jgi:hypothetical protein
MAALLKSTIITLVISLGLAYSLRQLFGFWECFTLASIFQYILFFMLKSKKIQETSTTIQELTDNIDSLIEKQLVSVQCPCGKNNLPVVIFLDESPIVECDKCNNSFRVSVEIQTQLITEPVNMENIYNKLKEQQYN